MIRRALGLLLVAVSMVAGGGTAQAVAPYTPVITGVDISAGLSFTATFRLGSYSGVVTKYEYSTDSGTTWRDIETDGACVAGADCKATITGDSAAGAALTYGSTYQLKLRISNADGTSPESAVRAVYFSGVPLAPVLNSITTAAASLTLSYTLGADGGNTVSAIQYSTDNGATWLNSNCAACSTSTSLLITQTSTGGALLGGVTYQVKIRSVNKIGTSSSSNMVEGTPGSTPVPPAGNAPFVPNITDVSQSGLSFTITFRLGTYSSPVTLYEYTTDGTFWSSTQTVGACAENADCKITVTDDSFVGNALQYGVLYNVRVRVSNSAGTSNPSGARQVLLSRSGKVPSAPVLDSVVGGVESITATITAGSANGSPIVDIEYSTDDGATWNSSGVALEQFKSGSIVITAKSSDESALVGGTSYPVRVRAVNLIGTGAVSGSKSATAIDTPMPPSLDSAVASGNSITVRYTSGLLMGGKLLHVEYTTDGGTTWASSGQTATPFSITATSANRSKALVSGTTYTVGVRAVTGAGASGTSNTLSVTVGKVPQPPTISTLVLSGNGIAVTGTYGFDNGSAVIRLEYSTDSGKTWATAQPGSGAAATSTSTSTSGTGSSGTNSATFSFTITAASADGSTTISPSNTYVVSVRAVNSIGAGASSAARSTIAGKTPSAAVITAATAGNTGIKIESTLGSGNGYEIIDVEYSTDGGKTWSSSGQKTGTFTIAAISSDGQTGLSGDTAYEIKIRGVNLIGPGAVSNSVTSTTYGRANKIIIEKVADKLLSAAPFSIKARSSAKTTVSFASSTPEACDVEDGKVVLYEAGKCTLIASAPGGGVYPAGSETISFNVLPVPVSEAGVAIPVRELSAQAGKVIPPKAKLTLKNLTPGVCMLKKQQIVGVAAGRCIIQVKYGKKAAYRVGTTIGG